LQVVNFTPIRSLVGGALIGLSCALLWILNGRVAGISGILGQLLAPLPGDARWRLTFLGGLVAGGLVMDAFAPASFSAPAGGTGTLIVAGLLVGFGTRLGNGCTSGHGLCGISRLSPRSLVATCVFMGVGMLTVFLVGRLVGSGS
jgi:uncharacterized membrane protein YedE/YeeE